MRDGVADCAPGVGVVPVSAGVGAMRSAVVAFVALVLAAVMAVGMAAPAGAAPAVCLPGQVATELGCVDWNTGDITRLVYGEKVPPKVVALSEQLDAVAGAGSTAEQRVGVAAANSEGAKVSGSAAAASGGGRWSGLRATARAAGTGLAVLSGAQIGYEIGGGIASFGCWAGVGYLCDPREHVPEGWVPNGDVIAIDAGFVGPALAFGAVSGSGWSGDSDISLNVARFGGELVMGEPWDPEGWLYARMPGDVGDGAYYFNGNGAQYRLIDTSGHIMKDGTGVACQGSSLSMRRVGDGSTHESIAAPPRCGSSTVPALIVWKYVSDADSWLTVMEGSGSSGVWNGIIPYGYTGYAPIGSAVRPPGPEADPVRYWQSQIECTNGTSTTTATAQSAPFRESDATFPPVPSVECPEGYWIDNQKIYEVGPDGPALQWEAETPQEVKDVWAVQPGCATSGLCVLTLWRVDQQTNKRTDCHSQDGLCAGWLDDPARDDLYQCTYGEPGHEKDVALSSCYVYGPSFDPDVRARGVPPYGDPRTGDPVPIAPKTPEQPGGTPLPDVPVDEPCWPNGVAAFNPLSWVLQPTKCALTWAFVPSAQTVGHSLAQAGTAVKSSAPVAIASAAIGAVGDAVDSIYGGSCSSNVIDVDFAYWVWPCSPPIPGWGYLYAGIALIVVVGGAIGAVAILREAVEPR